MKKLFFVIWVLCTRCVFAQLDLVAPITIKVYDPVAAQGKNLLLNTNDMGPYIGFPKQFESSMQLVRIERPYPPVMYISNDSTYLLGAEIQNDKFTFWGAGLTGHTGEFTGYVRLDIGNLNLVDSFQGVTLLDSLGSIGGIDNHDYQVDQHGRKVYFTQRTELIDIRCLSGKPEDTAVLTLVPYLIVLDSMNQPLLVWRSMDHISPCEMYWEYRNSSGTYSALNWGHPNSARFANDGNILYSLRHIGVGKINISNGTILWKLGGKDTTAISLADSMGYFLQHDFQQLPNGNYSLFSNGDNSHNYMEGLVYSIDVVNKNATLVSRYRPQLTPQRQSVAMGSYEYKDDVSALNMGIYLPLNSSSRQKIGELFATGDRHLIAEITGPRLNPSYQLHQTNWSIEQLRPKVSANFEGFLITDSLEQFLNYQWYKVGASSVSLAGTGVSFKPGANGEYVVDVQVGLSGPIPVHLVSDPIVYNLTQVANNQLIQVQVYPNPINEFVHVQTKTDFKEMIVTNIFGQTLIKSRFKEIIDVSSFSSGTYFITLITDRGDQVTQKIMKN